MNQSRPDVIASPANSTIRRLVRLRDHRRRRQAERVLVDGWKEILRAHTAGVTLRGLFVPDDPNPPPVAAPLAESIAALIAVAHSAGVLQRLTSGMMEKISYGTGFRGAVGEFDQPLRTLAQLSLPHQPFLLILDGVEKPGNIGAVFRCAEAAGVDAIILSDGLGDLFNPNAIRASLGAVFTLPAAVATCQETLDFLLQKGVRVMAARVESSTPLWACDWSGPLAVVLGSEAQGLGPRWNRLGDAPVAGIHIPMRGSVDSLNVSVSAALIAYEALRARSGGGPTAQG